MFKNSRVIWNHDIIIDIMLIKVNIKKSNFTIFVKFKNNFNYTFKIMY